MTESSFMFQEFDKSHTRIIFKMEGKKGKLAVYTDFKSQSLYRYIMDEM